MLPLAKYYFWHHHHPKPQTITLQPQSARFPEIPAMDEAGDFSHTPTQELRKGKLNANAEAVGDGHLSPT